MPQILTTHTLSCGDHEFNTFSIAARCPRTGAYGVAVSTARPGVGAVVPWVSKHGAIATQARTNTEIGRKGLALLEKGIPFRVALQALLASDPDQAFRQVHGVGPEDSFVHTGSECKPWCGHRVETGLTVSGNLLVGPEVLDAMLESFLKHVALDISARLMLALEAGQTAGGDKRGKQSAALLIFSDDPKPYHNLRVDDHPDPVNELRRLFDMMAGYADTLEQQYGREGVRLYRRVKA